MVEKNADKILLIVVIAIIGLLALRDSRQEVLQPVDTLVDSSQAQEEGHADPYIIVHITGEVVRPDVYELEDGARLIDAVEEAGGFTNKANEDGVNLALRLEDEMMVRIPSVDDEGATMDDPILMDVVESDKVNINSASSEELQTLSGIGPKTADKIIDYREIDTFEKIEDIMNVSGIGEKTFEDIKDEIRVR